jgi:hypothetical protein
MIRWFRRLIVLCLIGAAVTLALRTRRAAPAAAGPTLAPESTWPPLASAVATPPGPTAAVDPPAVDPPVADWVPPVDGACPDGYPIKANASSMIFHVPGGRFYERTIPQRCYATADAAERDGYRRAKA